MENFYENATMFPANIDVGILEIGRQSDFLDECTYLKMAVDFLKKIDKKLDEPLNEENFEEFSNYVNAPMGNKTRHKTEKLEMKHDFETMKFPDVGDINPVIFPMILLNRKDINERLLVDLEDRVGVKRNAAVEERIEKFKEIEQEKEEKLLEIIKKKEGDVEGETFYDNYFKPDDRYCYMKALSLYYFNSITPDETKTDLKMDFNLLSYLNFHYPCGNLSDNVNTKQTFEDIYEVVKYLDENQTKQFLEKMELDLETLKQKVEQEREQQYKNVGAGLLD